METQEITRRLDRQERTLHAILSVLAPQESSETGSGFDDLISALVDLTEAVADNTAVVAALRSAVSARSPAAAV